MSRNLPRRESRRAAPLALVAVALLLLACPPRPPAPPPPSGLFDSPELDRNAAQIRANAAAADLIFAGEVRALLGGPPAASGVIPIQHEVDYEILAILKGTYDGRTIKVKHLLVATSRHAAPSGLALNPAVFARGKRLIVFVKGGGKRFQDYDESYGTIRDSAKNRSAIATMLSLSP